MSSSIIASPIYLSPTNTNDGAENSPSFSFKNSPLTGIFRVSHDTLGISTAGVKRIQVSPSGLTTIHGGITIPSGLNANSTRPDVMSQLNMQGVQGPYEIRGISGTSPTSNENDDSGFLMLSAGGGVNGFMKSFISLSGYSFDGDMNANIVFGTGGTERVRLNRNLLVGSSGAGVFDGGKARLASENITLTRANLDSEAARTWEMTTNYGTWGSFVFMVSNGSGLSSGFNPYPTTIKLEVKYTGSTYNSTGTWGTISSNRHLKQDIQDVSSQWNDIKSIKFHKYRYIKDVEINPSTSLQMGVIAEELEQTCPNLVEVSNGEGEEKTSSIKYSIMYMKAVVALQEAMNRIEQLEARLSALENK